MFPKPVVTIRDPQSRNGSKVDSAAVSLNQVQAALRVRAALRAAHEDVIVSRLPDGQMHEWTWTVKPVPRPPLVATSTEELNVDELLANDSPGG